MNMNVAVEHQTGFTVDLFKTALQKSVDNQSNFVMSPISITTALAMAAAGAKGDTLAEITSVLKLPEGDAMHEFTSHIKAVALKGGTGAGGPLLLSFANGLWVDKSMSLKSKFQELVKGSYEAEVRTADFSHKAEEERIAINSWVLDETKGKIQDLLPPGSLDETTSLLLGNALYFKGPWAKQFDAEETRNADFHLLNGETVSVPFLTSEGKQSIASFDTYKVLKLPYAQGEDESRSFAMYIVLPHDKAGLPEVEKNLDAKTLVEHCQWTKKVPVTEFLLPKFKVSTGLNVPDALDSLGLKTPFTMGLADFSGMVEGPDANKLFLSEIVHKAFVEVNEEGTEAAAATVIEIESRSLPIDPPEDFIADHPFLFILKDDVTGVILFIGRITNPSLSE